MLARGILPGNREVEIFFSAETDEKTQILTNASSKLLRTTQLLATFLSNSISERVRKNLFPLDQTPPPPPFFFTTTLFEGGGPGDTREQMF